MSSASLSKIILFASLGLLGLVLIGIGSWMLLSPILQSPVSTPSKDPVITETSAPLVVESGSPFALPTGTQSPTQFQLVTKTEQPLATVITSLTPTMTPTAWLACPNAFLSHLRVGMRAKLSEEPPLPNRVREQANITSKILGMIQPGEVVEIIDGPGCSNDWVWWKVRKTDGLMGWTAEGDGSDYWLLPVIP